MPLILNACTPGGELAPLQSPDVSAIARNHAVELHWTAVEGALHYNAYYSKNKSDVNGLPPQLKTEMPEIVIGNLDNDVTYYFAVTAVGNSGESQINTITEITPHAAPGPPENVDLSAGNESLTVSWDAVKNADSYNIYIAKSPGITPENIKNLSGWIIIPNTSSPYVQTGLTNGITHHVVVTAENESGESEISTEQSVIPTSSLKLSVGANFACSILIDHSLWCWGRNYNGQIGDGTFINKAKPTAIAKNISWKDISAGNTHTCGIDNDLAIWCWGNGIFKNKSNALTEIVEPFKTELTGEWIKLFSGFLNVCAVPNNTTKNLQCWGYQSPLPSLDKNVDFQIPTNNLKTFESGAKHSCAIDANTSLWCWGENSDGRLGYGSPSEANNSFELGPISTGWRSVSVSRGVGDMKEHSCGIKTDESLWCWGSNTDGQLGTGTTEDKLTPANISIYAKWREITLGGQHSCGIQIDNSLWCWGSNQLGQLGLHENNVVLNPTRVGEDKNWREVSAFADNTCASKFDGTVWCTGSNSFGLLGSGSNNYQSNPIKILSGIEQFTSANYTACAIDSKQELFCWGDNHSNQLNNNSVDRQQIPKLLNGDQQFKKVALTNGSTCGINQNGNLNCWGYDEPLTSQLLDASETWVDIGVGYDTACAINSESNLWCFGKLNSIGLGQSENIVGTYTMKQMGIGKKWKSVVSGTLVKCAIDAENLLWCWEGENYSGELGVGDTAPHDTPTLVAEGFKWSSVAVGASHACAIREDLEMYCWGSNSYGQLGNGSLQRMLTPTPVEGNQHWLSVAVKLLKTCAIKDDNTLWCWGLPVDNTDRFPLETKGLTSPVQIGIDNDWKALTLGGNFICATKLNKDLYCWGENLYGQVGNAKAWIPKFKQVDFSDASITLH